MMNKNTSAQEIEDSSQHKMDKTLLGHSIIRMTAAEERELEISYFQHTSSYGPLLIASSHKGIVFIGFGEEEQVLQELEERYPAAHCRVSKKPIHEQALALVDDPQRSDLLPLHVKGTPFQLAVWEQLLRIPYGQTIGYGDIAQQINHPNASRAVGSAVGKNPIACLIPCHRVVRSNNQMGGYHWGVVLKEQLLKSESAK